MIAALDLPRQLQSYEQTQAKSKPIAPCLRQPAAPPEVGVAVDGIANARVEVTALAPRDDDVAATLLVLETDPVAQTAAGPPTRHRAAIPRVVDPDGHRLQFVSGAL